MVMHNSTDTVAGGACGRSGTMLERFRRPKDPTIASKTVTFGDGAAVVGNQRSACSPWSVCSCCGSRPKESASPTTPFSQDRSVPRSSSGPDHRTVPPGPATGLHPAADPVVHAAYSLGASKQQILRHVILPNALPEIFVGMQVALGVCWGTLVAAELVGADVGLGAMIWQARTFFRNGIVVFGIIVIGIIGVILDLIMRKLEDRFIPWRGKG